MVAGRGVLQPGGAARFKMGRPIVPEGVETVVGLSGFAGTAKPPEMVDTP